MILAFQLSDIVTVPFGWLLGQLYQLTNNYGIAMIIFAILVKLGHWENYDLPGAKTNHGSAQRLSTMIYGVIIIALCWISLLATHDAAEFACFQF